MWLLTEVNPIASKFFMKKIFSYLLYVWSAFILIKGIAISVYTGGSVQSTEFNMQVMMLGTLGSILVWLAIFGIWFALPKPESKTN